MLSVRHSIFSYGFWKNTLSAKVECQASSLEQEATQDRRVLVPYRRPSEVRREKARGGQDACQQRWLQGHNSTSYAVKEKEGRHGTNYVVI